MSDAKRYEVHILRSGGDWEFVGRTTRQLTPSERDAYLNEVAMHMASDGFSLITTTGAVRLDRIVAIRLT